MNANFSEIPRDDFAESSLIAALLIGRNGEYVVSDHLSGLEIDDWLQPKEQAIFGALRDIRERDEACDAGTVAAELERTGVIRRLWSSTRECAADLMRRMNEDSPVWNVDDWVRRIRSAAVKRRALQIVQRIQAALVRPSFDPDEIAHDASQVADLIRERSQKTQGPIISKMQTAAEAYLQSLNSDVPALIETGIPELDSAIGGGVEPGEMIVIAARPSHGKTVVGSQMAHHATMQGIPVAYFSEEMSAERMAKRTVQFATGIHQEHWRVRNDAVRQDVDVHFHDRAPFFVVEQSRTAVAVAEKIRRLAKDEGVRFVVVDYLQLLAGRGKTRYEQITDVSITLRQVANETGIVLVTLAQLNREIEKRSPVIPHVSDLKDSGQIEQDADVIVFLVWPHRLDSAQDPAVYQMFIAKNRNREIVTPAIVCKFDPSRQRIITMPAEREPEPDYSRGWQ